MKKLGLILAGFFVICCATNLWAISADEVLQGVENRFVGKTSKAEMNMNLVDSNGKERSRKMIVYRRKADNANKDNFIHFLSPSDMKDTTYLVNEKNRDRQKWIYLSAFKNTRKIAGTDYHLSFVSSDFSYEDMDDIHADDYTCSNLKEETLDGEAVYSIDTVKKDGNTSYAKTVLKVSKEKMLVLKSIMYDKKAPGKVIKELTAKNIQKVQDIWTPNEVTMTDIEKGSTTTLAIKKIEYDVALDDTVFSQRNMQK